jgi:diphthine-ammonia ligase
LDVCHSFMPRAVEGTGVELIRPLWELPRSEILEDIWKHNFEVLISCLNITKFDADLDVETFVGQKLSKELLQKVRDHNAKFGRDVDLAGEFGEFHTMVLDAPLFKNKIDASSGQIVRDGDFAYWSFSTVA